MIRRAVVALLVSSTFALAACEGPVGPMGDPGPPGEAGPPGPPGPGIDGSIESPIPLEPEGLVGRVLDTAGLPVAGASVVLVPAADVAALAATPIDLFADPAVSAASTVDEPIEDLLDARAGELASATTDSNGVYRFTTLADADVFVVVRPADGDAAHLPGGSLVRAALGRSALVGTRADLRVSTRPSDDARYVGSAACVGCHGRHRAFGTAHFVGLSVPRVRGYQQDTSGWPRFDAALDRFDAGATLFFFDCDAAASGPRACAVSETEPSPTTRVSFTIALERVSSIPLGVRGAYRATFENRRAAGSASWDVELSYGGALERTLFVASLPGGASRFVLPMQWNHAGDEANARPEDRPWSDRGSADFYDHAAGVLRAAGPATERSFDRQCAGCHFTGFTLEGDASSGFRAQAIASSDGAYDYDRDLRLEQINVGCEGCHGPGSEHLEAPRRGEAIVSPGLLTPERALAICGACHSNTLGVGGETAVPMDAAGRRPRPGIRRSELLGFFGRSEATAGDLHASGDALSHRLQYADFVRTDKHRNASILLTCESCHDAHGSEIPHDLRFAPDDNAGCTSCHSSAPFTSVRMHVEAMTSYDHTGVEDDDLDCTACHVVRTARSGAAVREFYDDDPSTATPVQYYRNDLGSHRYRTSGFEVAAMQPASVTHTCAPCHRTILPNP